MTSAVVQAPASVDIVVDALGTLAPGWRDRTGISHADGWSTVPMGPPADRFAPLLAQLLGIGVLRWEIEAATCRVTYFRPDGAVHGPVDTTDAEGLDSVATTFQQHHATHARAATGKERARLLGEASAATTAAAERHRAVASVLGVPYGEPVAPAESNPSVPVFSEASVASVAGPWQRRRRLEQAHKVVGFVAYAAGVGAVVSVFEPGWPINVVVIALALTLFGTRWWMKWRLDRMRQEQAAVS